MSTVTYNSQTVSPSPIISNIKRIYTRSDNGEIIGVTFHISMKGVLYNIGGFNDLMVDKANFADLWSCEGHTLVISCDEVTLLEACIETIELSFLETQNNWATSIDYQLELTTSEISSFASCPISQNLRQVVNEWSIQEDPETFFYNITGEDIQPKRFIVSHNVSATAKNTCTGEEGWLIAKDWVDEHVGFDTGVFFETVGPSCLTGYDLYNETRVYSVGKSSGQYSVSETWLLQESISDTGQNPYPAREIFTVTIQEPADSSYVIVNVEGTINGFESATHIDGCKSIDSNKYDNALGFWENLEPNIHQRAQTISGYTLHAFPESKSVVKMPNAGQINYIYVYNNNIPCIEAPTGCNIKKENIEISYENPTDIYGEIQILGRPCPLLQCLNMKTKGSKTLAVDIVVDCAGLCPGDSGFSTPLIRPSVEALFDTCYEELTGSYETVVEDKNSESWNPKTGTYFKSKTWSYSQCCETTETGFEATAEESYSISGGSFTPIMNTDSTITGSTTGDEILLPRAGKHIGKRLRVYNTSENSLEIALQSGDSFFGSPDTTLETGIGMLAVVVANNTWSLTDILL